MQIWALVEYLITPKGDFTHTRSLRVGTGTVFTKLKNCFQGTSICNFLSNFFLLRAPELLYGARNYSEAVDLWSVGCIFGELLNFSPIFPGENDIDQLGMVIRILGTPSEQVWPGVHGKKEQTNSPSFER